MVDVSAVCSVDVEKDSKEEDLKETSLKEECLKVEMESKPSLSKLPFRRVVDVLVVCSNDVEEDLNEECLKVVLESISSSSMSLMCS